MFSKRLSARAAPISSIGVDSLVQPAEELQDQSVAEDDRGVRLLDCRERRLERVSAAANNARSCSGGMARELRLSFAVATSARDDLEQAPAELRLREPVDDDRVLRPAGHECDDRVRPPNEHRVRLSLEQRQREDVPLRLTLAVVDLHDDEHGKRLIVGRESHDLRHAKGPRRPMLAREPRGGE